MRFHVYEMTATLNDILALRRCAIAVQAKSIAACRETLTVQNMYAEVRAANRLMKGLMYDSCLEGSAEHIGVATEAIIGLAECWTRQRRDLCENYLGGNIRAFIHHSHGDISGICREFKDIFGPVPQEAIDELQQWTALENDFQK